MALSEFTVKKLASALTPEVVEYIYNDDRWISFMIELISDAIVDKLGELDLDLHGELCAIISEYITLSGGDSCRTVH